MTGIPYSLVFCFVALAALAALAAITY